MLKTLLAAAATTIALVGTSSAATLTGTFTMDIYQRTGANVAESAATEANLAASTYLDTITYTGEIDFGTYNTGNNGTCEDCTTIAQWLASATGTVTGLMDSVGMMQLSKPNIHKSTATTTFFDIVGYFGSGFDSVIRHDDGVSLFDDGSQIASYANPTGVRTTLANGFDGGEWNLIYAATNGDPSVLRVTGEDLPTTVVPVPAALPLLLTALGGLAIMRRRA